MWSSDEIDRITELFPEAVGSNVLQPRPPSNLYVQSSRKNTSGNKSKPDLKRSSKPSDSLSLVDPSWELIDPIPDVRALFSQFNSEFFYGALDAVEVKWSSRMTLCAGLCCYEGRGGLCCIKLSEPLLKLRPRSDLIQTLLHEMIHAYLFVTQNDRDREAHGPNFQSHMRRINTEAGTHITIYHTFHDEVANYQTHWWRCTGPCQTRPPFFGFVRRAMNRAPGPNDTWWAQHQATCSGRFVKIKEPEKKKKSLNKKTKTETDLAGSKSAPDIRTFFKEEAKPSPLSLDSSEVLLVKPTEASSSYQWPESGGHVLGGTRPRSQSRLLCLDSASRVEPLPSASSDPPSDSPVVCPVCGSSVPTSMINQHLDDCLS